MFLRGWDIRIQQIFHSKIIRNPVCNPSMIFDTSNYRKSQKVTQNGVQWRTPNPPKIIKNQFRHPLGTPWVHMCPTWSPKWCPWTSKRTQNGPLETQKTTEFNKKSNIQQAYLYFQFYNLISTLQTVFSIPANPCSQQIRSQLVARGAGGRGEALRSAPTPQGVTGRAKPEVRSSGSKGSGGSAPAAGPSKK